VTCEALFARMGFECRQRSAGVYRVFTPLTFADGEPIGLYFQEDGTTVRVSDNANTLFHLRGRGIDLDSRKKWKGLTQIVSSFGMKLEESGEVTGLEMADGAAGLVARYLGAMLAIADFERDKIGLGPELSEYIDEVETHLRLWKPTEKLERGVYVTGHSGRVHEFHFKLAEDLIEAARPQSRRTGSILRKAVDVQNSSTPAKKIIVVIDDREDEEQARVEADILGTIANVLPFSRLARSLSGATGQRPQ
jgi:hypothetical protein